MADRGPQDQDQVSQSSSPVSLRASQQHQWDCISGIQCHQRVGGCADITAAVQLALYPTLLYFGYLLCGQWCDEVA